MASSTPTDDLLTKWYRSRIGQPDTADEALGYWVFAIGAISGILGIILFLPSTTASSLRQWSIVLAALGLVLILAGPLIRLPLRRMATLLVYLGSVICALAILWFIVAFPRNWSPQTGQPTIIALYSAGLFVVGLGGVFVPLLTDPAGHLARMGVLQTELDDLRQVLSDTEADEADLGEAVATFRRALEDAEADRGELTALADRLRGDVADTEADEADLASELQALRTSQARFELYEDKGNQWRWRLRHRNGNLIADCGEGYTRRHNAQKGLHSVRRNALGAAVLQIEKPEALPEVEEEFVPVEEVDSRATFELYEDRGGDHRWRLRHDNGDILADSAEGYASRGGLDRVVERLREYVGPADYLWFDPAGFEVYRDTAGEWRWRLVHRNGNIIADGGEGYTRYHDARRAVDRIRDRADELEFEGYEDTAGEYRWRLKGKNDRIVADSGEGYASRDGAESAAERLLEYAPEADVLDIGQAAFEIYEGKDGEHRWRLRHRNGNILADSGQGYPDRSGARDGIESVKLNAPNADEEESES